MQVWAERPKDYHSERCCDHSLYPRCRGGVAAGIWKEKFASVTHAPRAEHGKLDYQVAGRPGQRGGSMAADPHARGHERNSRTAD
eukprot:5364270-Pyramimonas_sp.AAC.1